MMFLLTDHSGLNKFWGHDDPNFKNVCGVIEEMVRSATRIVENNCNGKKNQNGSLFFRMC